MGFFFYLHVYVEIKYFCLVKRKSYIIQNSFRNRYVYVDTYVFFFILSPDNHISIYDQIVNLKLVFKLLLSMSTYIHILKVEKKINVNYVLVYISSLEFPLKPEFS